MSKHVETLTSRKFWATIVAAVLAYEGVDPAVVAVIVGYVVGQGIADAGKAAALKAAQ
jgi:hypothetical protein